MSETQAIQPSPGEEQAARDFALQPAKSRGAMAAIRKVKSNRNPAAGFSGKHAEVNANLGISKYWWQMAPVFVACVLFAGIISGLPPLLSLGGIFLATMLVGASGLMMRWLEDETATSWQRSLAIGILTPLPMFLFGAAIGWWGRCGDGDWNGPLVAFVMASTIATFIQSGRRHALFSVILPGWGGVALFAGIPSAIATVMALIPIAVFVSHRQVKAQRAAFLTAEARDRVRRRAEEILMDFEWSGQGWFFETDAQGNLTYVSAVVAEVLRKDRRELLGRAIGELFDPGQEGRSGERTLAFHMSSRSAFQELAVRAAYSDEERWWSISGKPICDSFGNYVGFRGSGHDLTEKRRSQEQATRLARYDSLTDLANRFEMAQTLDRILSAQHESQRKCAVFLLDLDRFKQVNDTMGHPAGDALLQQVSQRLSRVVGEHGQVGRLGGDEFKVIIPGSSKHSELAGLAHRIIESLSQPYSIDGHRVTIGASVGIAIAPEDGKISEDIVRNADLALYAAKDGGRGRYHFYATDLHSQAEEKRQLEQDLRDAIQNGDLELHYQPVVDAVSEQISGFEALMRWNHPLQGDLSPTKFIDVAEDTGLISAMGEWALRTACHDLARWPEHVRVAVNVSPLQFANPQLPAIVTNALAQAGVSPGRLELEITESVFLKDGMNTDAMFAALKRIGVRLALDDFGTGYSSLGYLKKAPFDKIKIDQGFVRGATQPESRNGAIITSITSLAQALGMDTTAEGVETLDELELVRMLGCSHVQGFVYDKALPVDIATERLSTGLKAVATGPRRSRAVRQMMLRKVVLDHGGQIYHGTIRNISQRGALIEGLWNVPEGTEFTIALSEKLIVSATSRWCEENRMGVQFTEQLELEGNGRIVGLADHPGEDTSAELSRKIG